MRNYISIDSKLPVEAIQIPELGSPDIEKFTYWMESHGLTFHQEAINGNCHINSFRRAGGSRESATLCAGGYIIARVAHSASPMLCEHYFETENKIFFNKKYKPYPEIQVTLKPMTEDQVKKFDSDMYENTNIREICIEKACKYCHGHPDWDVMDWAQKFYDFMLKG